MTVAGHRAALLAHLQAVVPDVLGRYRTAYTVTADDAPAPVFYGPGPPPLTAAEGYPAVYVTPLQLTDHRRAAVPGEWDVTYRFEVIVYVRGDDIAHAQTQRDSLAAVLRAALIAAPRISDRADLDPVTLTERYSAVEPAAGLTLAGVAVEFDVHATEGVFPPPPGGTADTIDVDVRRVAVAEPL